MTDFVELDELILKIVVREVNYYKFYTKGFWNLQVTLFDLNYVNCKYIIGFPDVFELLVALICEPLKTYRNDIPHTHHKRHTEELIFRFLGLNE